MFGGRAGGWVGEQYAKRNTDGDPFGRQKRTMCERLLVGMRACLILERAHAIALTPSGGSSLDKVCSCQQRKHAGCWTGRACGGRRPAEGLQIPSSKLLLLVRTGEDHVFGDVVLVAPHNEGAAGVGEAVCGQAGGQAARAGLEDRPTSRRLPGWAEHVCWRKANPDAYSSSQEEDVLPPEEHQASSSRLGLTKEIAPPPPCHTAPRCVALCPSPPHLLRPCLAPVPLTLVPAEVDGDHVLEAEVPDQVRLQQRRNEAAIGGIHVQRHVPAPLLRTGRARSEALELVAACRVSDRCL